MNFNEYVFNMLLVSHQSGPEVSAQDLTEDEEAEAEAEAVDEDVVDDVTAEDEDDEAEVEDDENAELVSDVSKNTSITNVTNQYNCTLWNLLLCSLQAVCLFFFTSFFKVFWTFFESDVMMKCRDVLIVFLFSHWTELSLDGSVSFLINNHMLSVWCETWNQFQHFELIGGVFDAGDVITNQQTES